MSLTLTFAFSGVAVAVLLAAKRVEERYGRTFILLDLISRGDHKVREWSHNFTLAYPVLKERVIFFVQKQLPMHIKRNWNKISELSLTLGQRYMEKARGAKILRRKEGISEFFKNISEGEKGNGEATELIEESFQKDEERLK